MRRVAGPGLGSLGSSRQPPPPFYLEQVQHASCPQEPVCVCAVCTLPPGRVTEEVGCPDREREEKNKQESVCPEGKSQICHRTSCVTLRELPNLSGPHGGAAEVTREQMWRMGSSAFRALSTGAGQRCHHWEEQALGMGEPRGSPNLHPALEGYITPHPRLPLQKQRVFPASLTRGLIKPSFTRH